jgi:hypothetical protein
MQTYRDWDNDSNVVAYENGNDYIIVEFRGGIYKFYKYTVGSAGSHNISEMQRLANSGDGLNAFINDNKPGYEYKW